MICGLAIPWHSGYHLKKNGTSALSGTYRSLFLCTFCVWIHLPKITGIFYLEKKYCSTILAIKVRGGTLVVSCYLDLKKVADFS